MTEIPSHRPLAGKRALITGGSRGIGRGTVIELARRGADVVINYNSSQADAEEVAGLCQELGVRAKALQADAGTEESVQRLVDDAHDWLGGLDIVVSNAAFSDRQLMLDVDMEGFQRTIDVTMWGPFHLVRIAARKLVDAGAGGNIVVVSSPHAVMAIPGSMAYNMAKAAIDQMARTAAVELAQYRIRVNIVHPGWIDTPGERKFFSEDTLREQGEKLPWGRLGKSEEIGRGVAFLCDPESEYITGSTLTIDGGIQLPWREMYRTEEKPDA
ncbi:MAG: SDR family oxidoreductase [Planctomycetaceae bacterium]|nr:MAG: SDR family oxidoreductase [Planctomycetaceae bacterium]